MILLLHGIENGFKCVGPCEHQGLNNFSSFSCRTSGIQKLMEGPEKIGPPCLVCVLLKITAYVFFSGQFLGT